MFRVIIILLLLLTLIPASSSAATGNIPEDILSFVPESDIVELMYLAGYYRSAELLAYLEAMDEILVPAMTDVTLLLGEQIPALPDFRALQADYITRLEAIRETKTVTEAEALVRDLESEGQHIATTLQETESRTRVIEPELIAQGEQTEAKIRAMMEPEIELKVQAINDEINSIVEQRVAEMRARIQYLIMQEAIQTTINPNNPAIGASLQAQRDTEIAQFTAQLTEEMNTLGEQRGTELQQWANLRVEELTAEYAGPFLRIRDNFSNMGARLDEAATLKMADYTIYEEQYLAKKKDIITRVISAQLEKAKEQIKAHASDFELAWQSGQNFPTMEEFLAEFQTGWDILQQNLMAANSEAEANSAIAEFSQMWQEKQAEMEALRPSGSSEILKTIQNEIKVREIEEKLAIGKEDIMQSIALLKELKESNDITPEQTSNLENLYTLLSLLNEAQNQINEINAAGAEEDVEKLLQWKSNIVTLLQQIGQITTGMAMTDEGYLTILLPESIPVAAIGVTG